MYLDDDQTALALAALQHVANDVARQSANESLQSGCDGASKSCIDWYCLPKLRALIDLIQQHQLDEKNGD